MSAFGGRENHEHRELFFDVVEAMLDVRRDEYDRARLEGVVLCARPHARLAADHIVELVLAVRGLCIDAVGGEHIKAGAHRSDAQELEVRIAPPGAFPREAGEVLEVTCDHDPLLTKLSSNVNGTASFSRGRLHD
jgi:hypothetical protein